MSRFLVIGSGGFIGSRLVSSLLQEGHVVVGYNRSASDPYLNERYHNLFGDFSSETRFEQILTEFKVDIVFHLISTTVPQEKTEHIEKEIVENILPTVRLLEAMSKSCTKSIVFTSSGGTVYGELSDQAKIFSKTDPICSYGIQKLTIEKYLALYHRMHSIDYRIARIANPYGITKQNRVQGIIPVLIRNILSGRDITLFGDTIRDYIHIQDVTNGLKRLCCYSGSQRVFNLGSGQGTSLSQLIEMIENITNKRFSLIRKCPLRSCDVQKNVLDISLTKKELNWKPEIPLEVGIERLVHQLEREQSF